MRELLGDLPAPAPSATIDSIEGWGVALAPVMSGELLVTIDSDGPIPGQLRIRGRAAAVEPERFIELAARHVDAPRYERVIFVGDGEALEQHGFGLVEVARAGGFAHVRLDTSARRLTEPRQVRAVVLAGVDEFSVGLHGHEAALHDRLTARPGEFAKTQTCLEHLARHDVRVLVDVVVTSQNLEVLASIVELALEQGAARVALWTHSLAGAPAVEIEPEERELFVRFDRLVPALDPIVASCRAADVELVIRHVPRCMLGPHAELLDNSLPEALDGVRPGRPLAQFNCLLEAKCEHAEACLGLGHGYVNAFGWELEQLEPTPRTRAWRERDRSIERSTGGAAGPRGHAEWLALLGEHAALVESVALTRTEARYLMQMSDGTQFVLVVTARDEVSQTFTQSRSFNLAYTDVEGPAAELDIAAYLEPVFATIIANDDGTRSLDAKR